MKYRKIFSLFLLFFSLTASAQSIDEQIESLINQMTLEEKVRMCFGGEHTGWVIFPGVDRLGIPLLDGSDGPRGLVLAPVTVFPSGLGYASTWNTVLAEEAGKVIGEESRNMSRTVLFGPAFNINRDPLGARFFEYMSEDPVLSGKIAAAQIRGMQSEQVAACAKHFACNGRDWNRDNYYTKCDERTLREIYLRGFEIAVKEGNPWAVMTAANGLNDDYCSDNHWLLTDVLKNEWGFKGIVLTDFCHSKSTVKAALAGLDVDMPWGNWNDVPFGKRLLDAVNNGEVSEEILNDKVRRNLWMRSQIGNLPGQSNNIGKGDRNTPAHQKVALKMAEEGLVLLKNEGNILPVDATAMHKVVVIGPNAAQRIDAIGLGGSSGATAPFEVTALQGLEERLEGQAEVSYIPLFGEGNFKLLGNDWVGGKVDVTYTDGNGNHATTTTAPDIDFSWVRDGFPEGTSAGNLRVEIHGKFVAPATGRYIFRLSSDDPADLWVEDMGASTAKNGDKGAPQQSTGLVDLELGKTYDVKITYKQTPEGAAAAQDMNYWAHENAELKLEWSAQGTVATIRKALQPYTDEISQADLVVFVGGIDHNLDCEGRDRKSMDFPSGQAELIRQVAQLNAKTVVALYHGSPLTLPWLDDVPAVIDLFYPGMFGGTALAEAIFGDINPSGKLTFSWPAQYSDAPVNLSTQDFNYVYCDEKLNVGYRYYDSPNATATPLFPFGYGLSYTTFDYSGLNVSPDGKTVSVMVTNTGSRKGSEAVQLYIAQPNATVERPRHELKAFSKVELNAGESQWVTFTLSDEDYSYYDVESHGWVKDPAPFVIEVGASSRDIRQTQEIDLTVAQEHPIPVCYLLICCRTENKGTKFLVNSKWEANHDYKNIDTVRDILQKIKSAGINTVGIDFTNPSMWDVPVYDSQGHLVDDFSSEFMPMLDNIIQVCEEKDMHFFLFLGDPNAWTMKYWNTIAKRVWEEYVPHPNYQYYGYDDNRPLLVMFLYGTAFWSTYNNTPANEKDYISKFHIGTCQINGPIIEQSSDGWGYRNFSQSSTGNVRFACPNGGVPPTDWYRIDDEAWKERVDWAMEAHHYAVFGSYDDTCDGIFWGISDVSESRSEFHKNSKTIDKPYIYYDILRDKLRSEEGNVMLITQDDGRETAYTQDDHEISLTDALMNSNNPVTSVRVLQAQSNCEVTYRRRTEGKWESLALPFAFNVTEDLLNNFDMAVPCDVISGEDEITLEFRLLKADEHVNAYMPILIKGRSNAVTTSLFSNVSLQPSTSAQTTTVSGDGYHVEYTANSQLQTLWPMDAFTISSGYVNVASQQQPINLYPYRFYFTVKNDDGVKLYPGKTQPGVMFDRPSIVETPTGIRATFQVNNEEGAIYNLQGQYMGKDLKVLPAGIYLQNGKKIVIR